MPAPKSALPASPPEKVKTNSALHKNQGADNGMKTKKANVLLSPRATRRVPSHSSRVQGGDAVLTPTRLYDAEPPQSPIASAVRSRPKRPAAHRARGLSERLAAATGKTESIDGKTRDSKTKPSRKRKCEDSAENSSNNSSNGEGDGRKTLFSPPYSPDGKLACESSQTPQGSPTANGSSCRDGGGSGGKRHKVESVPRARQENEENEEEELSADESPMLLAFDPYRFIKSLPRDPPVQHSQVALPRRTRQTPPVTLVLDLDETLVHCSTSLIPNYELKFLVKFGGIDYPVYVRRRPHLFPFLKKVSEWFEVVIFTASQKVYADKLLNIIDPHRKYIRHRLFRESCVVIDGKYIKDLSILGRPLEKCAIIDNSPQAFGFQLDNGIPIESWFDNDKDRELLDLLPFLKKLKDINDVRPCIRNRFRLKEYVESL